MCVYLSGHQGRQGRRGEGLHERGVCGRRWLWLRAEGVATAVLDICAIWFGRVTVRSRRVTIEEVAGALISFGATGHQQKRLHAAGLEDQLPRKPRRQRQP